MTARKYYPVLLSAIALFFAGIGSAYAVTSTFHATVAYRSPLTITQTVPMDFGYIKAATVATYKLDTNNGLTTSGAGVIIGGTPKTGQYSISGTALINISACNFSTPATHGAVLSAPVCSYKGGAPVAGCSFGGTAAGGGVLKVGFTVATTAAGTDGLTDSPAFDLTVVYQ
jgi:hypothetical protein